MTTEARSTLAALLRHRLAVIADHPLRDRDPAAHLQALAAASQAIDEWSRLHSDTIPPRLRHFLDNASFDKALAFLEPTA